MFLFCSILLDNRNKYFLYTFSFLPGRFKLFERGFYSFYILKNFFWYLRSNICRRAGINHIYTSLIAFIHHFEKLVIPTNCSKQIQKIIRYLCGNLIPQSILSHLIELTSEITIAMMLKYRPITRSGTVKSNPLTQPLNCLVHFLVISSSN